MKTTEFIADCLRGVHVRLMGTCKGLMREQVLWRPTPVSNNIGFILWHTARAEDGMFSDISGDTLLWESEGWHERFGQPADAPDPGDRLGLRGLNVPELDILTGYLEVVHRRAQAYLAKLNEADLQVALDPARPYRTRAALLRHMITHKNNHHGQVDFIRGLRDDVWDLPQGTGIELPA